MRIKFCGLTRIMDVHAAAAAGANALGFVCVPTSKRFVSAEQARDLVVATPAFVQTVGLFQDAGADTVKAMLEVVPFDLLQFHGNESNDYCAQFGRPFIKAIPMRDAPDLLQCASTFKQAKALLLDSHSLLDPKQSGGSGQAFDWQAIALRMRSQVSMRMPIILAGGLKPENVAAAIAELRPQAVDVSSGIESAPGVKDAEKMRAFVAEARMMQ
jgi:phosphoribosylanthranilate isomerase